MAKSRKRKYTWFPGLGQFRNSGEVEKLFNPTTVTLSGIGNTEVNVTFPIAADEGEDEDPTQQAASFLNDSLGQDYFIERIVGSIFVACQQIEETTIHSMTAAVGIFVGPKTPNAPTQALGAGDSDTYSPLLALNADQPWMFRRIWIVGNLAAPIDNGFGNFPPTNAAGHDLAGPSVDVRSVRRVHKNERLFMTLSIVNTFDFENGAGVTLPQVSFAYDFRILGALRRARNTSTFRA